MNYLSVENISKTYGIKQLFTSISFGLNKGEKAGLIARNGAGKTTLLKILAGIEKEDEGGVVFRKSIKVGYLAQKHSFDLDKTIEEIIYESSNPNIQAIIAYEEGIAKQVNEEKLNALIEQMNTLNAWDFEAFIAQVLENLKIGDKKLKLRELSGGQQKRVALAKLLIDQPDLLLLDEPTNHLDLEIIEWLEEYLSQQNMTILMVTHDRYFLENVCDIIFELDRETLFKYEGNYSYFVEKKAEREQQMVSNISKAKNLMRKELEWMRRMPKARGTKSKSRVDAFYDLKKRASQRIKTEELSLDVKMDRLGSKIVELHKVSKSFEDKKILEQFSYNFNRQEKLGIVGKNGTGKSTFLNLITGKLNPDQGKIVVGETISFGYYRQEGIQLKEDKRVIEVVKDIAEYIALEKGKKLSASQFLERFNFPTPMHYQYVSTLSGGEKRRLFLLTVLVQNPNFLILDEPTNDLDIFTMNVLEEYLENFKGCLIVVSHDRYFMDKIVDHLFVFNGEGIINDVIGGYSTWFLQKQQEKEASSSTNRINTTAKNNDPESNKAKTKLSFNEKREFGQLEADIPRLEKRKKALEEELQSPSISFDKITELSEELGKLIKTIDEKTDRWLELSEFS